MTRQVHDQLAKEYLKELLKPLGKVETSKDVKSEVQEIKESSQVLERKQRRNGKQEFIFYPNIRKPPLLLLTNYP
ncbi:hypothetical protein [Dolichospermum flos-aquae]|uniref:hypothetical protein n=1 Tax=Dolichospermum flosaquae TaxID=1166 RepID=UPI002AD34251|nr:hypothetical protein [Dolichospermum flos-aquae]